MASPTTRPPRRRSAVTQRLPTFTGAGLTHVGRVRDTNEDAILTDPDSGTLWAVADGMGGYGHGDLASDIVTGRLALIEDNVPAIPAMRRALEDANALIQTRSAAPDMGRMGATVVAMILERAVAHIVWAGDCRAYLMRQGHLKLLTRDHTLVQDLVDDGVLSPPERDTHPDAHVVTRAVGYEDRVEIDALSVPVVPQDRIMLCSDGVTTCLGDHEIADHAAAATTPKSLCAALVDAALTCGAPDNVSVVAVFAKGVWS